MTKNDYPIRTVLSIDDTYYYGNLSSGIYIDLCVVLRHIEPELMRVYSLIYEKERPLHIGRETKAKEICLTELEKLLWGVYE